VNALKKTLTSVALIALLVVLAALMAKFGVGYGFAYGR
jgi:hypothetical protein